MLYEHRKVKRTAVEWLNYWIQERERVRQVKEGVLGNGVMMEIPKPWSEDPIFQKTYFCNVRREDDKVTRWIRANWTPENWAEEYDYYMVLARMLNNIPCLESVTKLAILTGGFTLEELQEHLEERAEYGGQVWGGAYLVSTHGIAMPKAAYLCQRVLPAAHAALVGPQTAWGRYMGSAPTLARCHELLMRLEGLGSFMAAQVIADLKNTKGHPLDAAIDWANFSAPGPGSLRGLKWVFEHSTPGTYQKQMADLCGMLSAEAAGAIMSNGRWNMQDLQNCLCEFDKFMRVMTGTGKSKRKYEGL